MSILQKLLLTHSLASPIHNDLLSQRFVVTESIHDLSFDSLCEEFLDEHRLGIGCSVTEFAERYPSMKDRMLHDLPALLALEQAFTGTQSLPKLPKLIGKYELGKEIGRGGMGVVYAATHPSLGTDLAIKVLSIGRFRQKAKSATLQH